MQGHARGSLPPSCSEPGLTASRTVELAGHSARHLVKLTGSGDLVATAQSSDFCWPPWPSAGRSPPWPCWKPGPLVLPSLSQCNCQRGAVRSTRQFASPTAFTSLRAESSNNDSTIHGHCQISVSNRPPTTRPRQVGHIADKGTRMSCNSQY